ncbi:hypothetical protein KKG31_06525 [Patescibacteria group bacterium]|nr:hypothetical protein [Patescibacteria group bacterium]MBU1758747.1 hypothetical protein [Patescibacteria group bacterium]
MEQEQEIRGKYFRMLDIFQACIQEMRRNGLSYMPIALSMLDATELERMKNIFGFMCNTQHIGNEMFTSSKTLFVFQEHASAIRRKRNFWMQCLVPEGLFNWNVYNILCQYSKGNKRYIIQSYISELPHASELILSSENEQLINKVKSLSISELIKTIGKRMEEFEEYKFQTT